MWLMKPGPWSRVHLALAALRVMGGAETAGKVVSEAPTEMDHVVLEDAAAMMAVKATEQPRRLAFS